jgi:hypothetical protein
MKTMEDINKLLKDFPRTEGSQGCVPFGVDAHVDYPDEEITTAMYNKLREQIDSANIEGKQIAIRVYPELTRRSQPNPDGSYRKDAYFRLAII